MKRFTGLVPLIIAGLVWFACQCGAVAAGLDSSIQFNRDVRPIRSKHCFACHGPNEQSREGGFRLDVRDSVLAEADSGERPIVPSDLRASELLRRIQTTEESERMPPQPHKRLTSSEQQTLRKWIAAGAKYQRH